MRRSGFAFWRSCAATRNVASRVGLLSLRLCGQWSEPCSRLPGPRTTARSLAASPAPLARHPRSAVAWAAAARNPPRTPDPHTRGARTVGRNGRARGRGTRRTARHHARHSRTFQAHAPDLDQGQALPRDHCSRAHRHRRRGRSRQACSRRGPGSRPWKQARSAARAGGRTHVSAPVARTVSHARLARMAP